MPMGGVAAPTYTPQPAPDYNNNTQTAPQGGYTGQPPMQHQGGMPQEQYSGGGQQYPQAQQPQYPPQGQAQYPPNQNQNQYPNPTLYSPGEQAGYPGPRDGVSEMQSPTEGAKMN